MNHQDLPRDYQNCLTIVLQKSYKLKKIGQSYFSGHTWNGILLNSFEIES